MNKVLSFLKKEVVLCVSFVLCVVSVFFVTPSAKYLDYIDFRTLALLFCLMTVMAGFRELGVFDFVAKGLLKKAGKSNQLYIVLILICFFSSMLITNDVALITFVPFTIIALKFAGQEKRLIYIVVMETIAANLGSMLTPLGNPQNLYLFSAFDMSGSDFLSAVLPYSILSLVLLFAGALFAGKDKMDIQHNNGTKIEGKIKIIIYSVLFTLSLVTVFRVIPYYVLLAVLIPVVLIFDRKIILKVDYSLLLTFVFLFVFIGNLGEIDVISAFLEKIVSGNEVPVAVAVSQVFSNVPACILLSNFTQNTKDLLVGVNLGGLGTLIASMASLISYKFVAKEKSRTGKYMLVFTLANVAFLALNLIMWLIIR